MMLADNIEGYKKQEERLKFDFKKLLGLEHFDKALNGAGGDLVDWVERLHPRKCVITLLLSFRWVIFPAAFLMRIVFSTPWKFSIPFSSAVAVLEFLVQCLFGLILIIVLPHLK